MLVTVRPKRHPRATPRPPVTSGRGIRADPSLPVAQFGADPSVLVAQWPPTCQFVLLDRRRPVSSCRRDQISRDAHSSTDRSWVVLVARIDGYGADKRCFLVIEASGRELRVNRSLSAMAVGLVVPTLVLGGCSGDPKPKIAPSESSSPVASRELVSDSTSACAASPAGPVHRQSTSPRSPPRSPPETATAFLALSSQRLPELQGVRQEPRAPRTTTVGAIEGGSCRMVATRHVRQAKSGSGQSGMSTSSTARERWYDGDGQPDQDRRGEYSALRGSQSPRGDGGAWVVREMRLR